MVETNDYAIIDIEIGNCMTRENWDNKKADIILIGALLCKNGEKQTIVQIPRFKDQSKEEYASIIKKLLDSLKKADYELFALNRMFEQEAIESYCGQAYTFNEVKGTFKGTLSSKDSLYGFLQKKLSLATIYDIFSGDAKVIPDYYQLYLSSGEYKFLQDIISHNLNCLLKEYYILKNLQFIEDNVEVDKNGFITKLGVENDG
jgi:hypothetical protein